MNTMRPLRALGGALLAGLSLLLASGAQAQDDPPGRAGRLAEVQGRVSWFDHEEGRWAVAERNRPLTSGDRLSTAAEGRVELRVGSTTLRLGGGSELELVRLDDAQMVFQLHSGQLALRVRSREMAREIEVSTPEARMEPLRSGHYRIDRVDDTTYAGSWRGELRVEDAQGTVIAGGQRVEMFREGRGSGLRLVWSSMPEDEFGAWVAREDRRDDQRSASSRYVSPEMTGAEDLDRYGRWDRHPEYGAVWYPLEVSAGWAPYRYGRWVWVRPWGWTWVDEAPWGFAPFHYGRWVWWGGRWGWIPGTYVARPVFAPALVAWVGGSNWGVTVNVGGPAVGWVPLAPYEVYVPWYRHTPRYVDRVNMPPPRQPGHRPGRPVPQVPTGPIMYSNQGVPGGVTVVSRDVLVSRQPVGRAVVEVPDAGRRPIVAGQAPPPHPVRRGDAEQPPQHAPNAPPPVQMVPGGAVPLPPPSSARQAPPAVAPAPVMPAVPVVPMPSGRQVTPAPQDRQVAPPPRRGGDSGEVIDLRRNRQPPPATGAAPAPQAVTPAAPVAPVAPAPAVVPVPRPAPAVAAPPPVVRAPQAAAPAPPVQVVPAPQVQAVPAPRPRPPEGRGQDDERKRIPDRPQQRERESVR